MKIAIAADHAGFELKDHLGRWLADAGHEVVDFGTDGPESVDYPDFGHRLADEVRGGGCERGLLVCGTGVGVAMTANRHPGIRAVNSLDLYSVQMSRAHNDANVLCLGARVVGAGLAEALLEAFLETPFEGGRHARRVEKIEPDS
jgi:ribose 5-phosphate isomerase B